MSGLGVSWRNVPVPSSEMETLSLPAFTVTVSCSTLGGELAADGSNVTRTLQLSPGNNPPRFEQSPIKSLLTTWKSGFEGPETRARSKVTSEPVLFVTTEVFGGVDAPSLASCVKESVVGLESNAACAIEGAARKASTTSRHHRIGQD
jgi:hypothetical protein